MGGSTILAVDNPVDRAVRPAPRALATAVEIPDWAPGRLLDSGSKAAAQLTSGFTPFASSTIRRISDSGATVSGLRIGASTAADYRLGWYEINTSNGQQTLLWPTELTNKVGFVRDGIYYGFYFMEFWGSYYSNWAAYDVATGAYLNDLKGNYLAYDYSTYVITSTYNASEDMGWIYTFNGDKSGMVFQKVEPTTMEMQSVNENVDITKAAFVWAYYPKDGNVYGITSGGDFGKVNPQTGEIDDAIGATGLSISTYLQAMVYSPIDRAFMAELILKSGSSVLASIDPLTGVATPITTYENSTQYAVLTCPDEVRDDNAPGVPTFTTLNFDKASLTGSGSATFSSMTFGGAKMTGTVSYTVNIDDQEAATGSGNPGSQVTFNLTTTEGLHEFTFIPWVKSGNSVLEGPSVTLTKYVGNDIPSAPANVAYDGTSVKWDAVTTGANDGYIDASKVTYNVYINDVKQNSSPLTATELAVTMPTGDIAYYTATVEAVCNGKTSEKGASAATKLGDAFALPFTMTPTSDEISLCTLMSGTGGSTYWRESTDYNYDDQVVLCHVANSSTASDDWVFLPKIKFDNAQATYEVTLEMRAGLSSYPEKMEVCIGDAPEASAMKKIASETLTNNTYKDLTYYFEVDAAGEKYIGIHCTSAAGMFYLFLHNVAVKRSVKTLNCPAEVTNLTATAGEKGALSATVAFKMPMYSIGGESLYTFDGNETLTATVTSGTETKTVTGAPGSRQSVEVATAQGDNTITVYATNATGDGAESTVSVYTGLARPAAVAVTAAASDDNMSLILSWKTPTTGVNGGYIDPTAITYNVWIASDNNWLPLDELAANATSYTYTLPAGTAQQYVRLGLTVSNVAGQSEDLAFASGVIGKPYSLPMVETFANSALAYEPIVAQALDENYGGAWEFEDPAYIESAAANATGTALIGYTNSVNTYARTALPKFSTKDVDKADVTVEFYIADIMPQVDVLICGNSGDEQVIGTVTNAGETGWRTFTFAIPDSYIGRDWCYVALRAKFENDPYKYAMLGSYTVKRTVAQDFGLTKISGYSDVTIGREYTYKALLRNLGYETVAMPQLNATFYSENGRRFTLPVELSSAVGSSIAANEEVAATITFEPNVEMVGEGVLTVNFNLDDLNASNNTLSKDIVVNRDSEPLVTDLSAIYNADAATVDLEWSEPSLSLEVETCEDLDASSYAETLGVWKNVDLDKEITYGTKAFTMTGMYAPKAWQVFSITETSDAGSDFMPHSGDQMLIAWSAQTSSGDVASDDWLISPEVQGGSVVQFYMNIVNAKYTPEVIEVRASSTGNNPEDFTTTVATFSKTDREWQLCTATLPKDAKYFAIHHVSLDKFAVQIDDIAYAPLSMGVSIQGYNVYDNGEKIATVSDCAHHITGIEPESTHAYNVTTVVKLANGNVIEYGFSNTAYVGYSALNEIPVESNGTVHIYDLQGRRIDGRSSGSGVYIINGTKTRAKL
jgi:hypothetical protein